MTMTMTPTPYTSAAMATAGNQRPSEKSPFLWNWPPWRSRQEFWTCR
jgi:hypothetical protein